MNLKEALDALLSGREIPPDTRELLAGFDPESLKEELSTLRNRLEEQENAKLTAEELLKKQLNAALSEKEALRKQHDDLERSTRVRQLAAEYGCDDPDYLDFLARKHNVDLKDGNAATEFLRSTVREKPGCFRAPVHPGSGSGTVAEKSFGAVNESPAGGCDRISRIVNSLNSAPVMP